MFSTIFIILFVILLLFLYNYKVHIDWQSLFKLGFAKHDDPFGLYCYTGKQGEGKTYSAIKFLVKQQMKEHYICLTNVHSYNAFENTIYIDDIIELITYVKKHTNKNGHKDKRYIIFFDEIFTVLMKGYSINTEILSFLAQLRKRGIIFVTTAQEWSEIPITFRRFCRFQVSCHMFSFLGKAFSLNRINDGYNSRWNNDTQDFEAPLLQTNFSKGNLWVIDTYDTYETIASNLNRGTKKR